nr:RNA-directed DNA polymerase, eukaryota [Tanacetum cinerariifolium]
REGGSILEIIDDMIKVGQAMGFTMEGRSKAKKDWIKELNNKHKVNFLSIQETKSDHISDMDIKLLWGNYKFDYIISESVGNLGGILCVWDPSVFCKEHHIISDNFIALYGSWFSNKAKLLMISIYAPQSISSKRMLWNFISTLIGHWDGHYMVMGDFNEVRCVEDRYGLEFNAQSANEFNSFISNSGLAEIQLEGYSFTWSLQSAKKMSKLDRFFVSDDLLSLFPHLFNGHIGESPVSRDEVRNAVWGCGENKSPGPDGYSFEFFRKFWDTLGSDFCEAVEWFFDHSSFSKGCNSSFIALIPKNQDPKFVNDYRPISLIGCLYKVVTKIVANRLSSVISGLISDV